MPFPRGRSEASLNNSVLSSCGQASACTACALDRVSIGALQRDRLAAANDLRGAKNMAQVGLLESLRFNVIKYLVLFGQGKNRTASTTVGRPMGFHVRPDRHGRQRYLLIEVLKNGLEDRVRRVPVDRDLMPLADLVHRKPATVAAVALANKIARTAWALLANGEIYRQPAAAEA